MTDPIPDGFEGVEELYADSVYRVLRAAATGEMGRLCLLKRLTPSTPPPAREAVQEFARRAAGISRANLFLPTAIITGPDGTLFLRYPHRDYPPDGESDSLISLNSKTLGLALGRCSALSDLVSTLHGAGLHHGGLSPKSVWVEGEQLTLDVPGYAELLDAGDTNARAVLGGQLAPEVRAGGWVSTGADVYGFATIVAHWIPEVYDSPWYRQATAEDPMQRFPSVTAAHTVLIRLLEGVVIEAPTIQRRVQIPAPAPKVEGSQTPGVNTRPLSSARIDPGGERSLQETRLAQAEEAPSVSDVRNGATSGGLLPDIRDDGAPRWLLGLLLGMMATLAILALSIGPVILGLIKGR